MRDLSLGLKTPNRAKKNPDLKQWSSKGIKQFSTGLGLIGIAKSYVRRMANTWHAQTIYDTQRLEFHTPARHACVVSPKTIKTIICPQYLGLVNDRACHFMLANIVMRHRAVLHYIALLALVKCFTV
jgi:hypothetical protein